VVEECVVTVWLLSDYSLIIIDWWLSFIYHLPLPKYMNNAGQIENINI